MKILVVAPTQFYADRGTPIRVREHLESLKRRGHDLLIVTYAGGADVPGLRIVRTPHFWKRQGDRFFVESFWRRIILDSLLVFWVVFYRIRFRPNVLLCYLHNGFLAGYLASFFSARRIVFDCHGLLVKEATEKGVRRSALVRRIIIFLERYMYNVAQVITVPSENIRREILRHYRVNPAKLKVASDGYATPLLAAKENVEEIAKVKRELGLMSSRPVYMFTGFLSKIAGVDVLIEAFSDIREKEPNASLVIVGYPFVDEYKAIAEKYGISSHVRFTGGVPYASLGRYLAAADIAVAPRTSGAEGNFKIVNYLAAGLPVVCFETPANRELAEDLPIYAHDTTPRALADALLVAASKLPEPIESRKRRQSFVTSRYSWDGLADALEARAREAAL